MGWEYLYGSIHIDSKNFTPLQILLAKEVVASKIFEFFSPEHVSNVLIEDLFITKPAHKVCEILKNKGIPKLCAMLVGGADHNVLMI